MKKSLIAASLLLAIPFAASAADGRNYNNVEFGYLYSDVQGPNADGFGLRGSFAVAPNFHLFGEASRQDIDHSPFDYNQYRLGVGYNRALNSKVDLVGRVAYERFDADWFKDNGKSVEVGLWSNLLPQLDGHAYVGYEDYNRSNSNDFYGRLGLQYTINQNWSASADVKFVDGDSQWFVGPRLSW